MLWTYLYGILLCTVGGFLWALGKRIRSRRFMTLGWPVPDFAGASSDLVYSMGVGAFVGILWPFLLIFIPVSWVGTKLGIF